MSTPSIEPSEAQAQALASAPESGPIVMLNLLRFKDRAEGMEGLSGEQAYARYGEAVAANIERVGARVEVMMRCAETVIGPEEERWDLALLVRYPSRAAFLQMVADPDFLAKHALRSAALADSRLICCESFSAG